MKKCGIIGAGAWGTAISTLIQSKNTKIYIWSRNKKTVKSINNNNKNEYLKGIKLTKKLIATSELRDLDECDYFFIATPTQKTSSIISDLSKFKSHYPEWKIERSLNNIIEEMVRK